jgi:iron complex outermembrane receptor protein
MLSGARGLIHTFLLTALTAGAGAAQERGQEVLHGQDVHGRVVNAEDGSPLSGTIIRLVELGRSEVTHADGSFHLEDLHAGTYTLEVDRLGFRLETVTIEVGPDGTAGIVIELQPQALELEGVVVSASPRTRRAGEAIQPVNVLSERELLRRLDQSLAATLENEPGLAMTSQGPNTQKPVIRGLSGDRVLVLEDGERVGDLSSSGADHAVATDAFSARRVEVVRGPAALLYGSNALGGVVNVVRQEIPRARPDHWTGTIQAEGNSVNSAGAVGGDLRFGIFSGLVGRVEGSYRSTGNLQTGEGVMENTNADVVNVAGGASWVGERGYGGASYRYYSNNYGIPGGFVGAHPNGVRIEMRRHQLKAAGQLAEPLGEGTRLELMGAGTDYAHTEYESSGIVGTAFDLNMAAGEVRLDHGWLGEDAAGAIGVRGQFEENLFGGRLDTEDTDRAMIGAYVFQSVTLDRLILEGGLRYDWAQTTPAEDDPTSEIGPIEQRTFGAFSGSVGGRFDLGRGFAVGANLSRAFRIPTVQELYSLGPHLAAYTFEVGNPTLAEETALGADAFVRLAREDAGAEISVFRSDIDNYIYGVDTGELSPTGLRIYQFTGGDAVLQGIEGALEWSMSRYWVLEGNASYVQGTLSDTDEPLPLIPPLRGSAAVRYERPAWFVETRVRAAADQDKVAEFETPTEGYTLLDVGAGLRLALGGRLHTLTLQVSNLTDAVYRNHLSLTKELLPEAGRAVRLLYRVGF